MRPTRVAGAIEVAMALCAGALLLSLAISAWHDASQAWDVWYYHLPFAARIAGIVDASTYAFAPANQARFDGFPLLAEAIQGALWKITGRPECANFLAFASVPLLALFLRRLFGVKAGVTIVALLAIPLVQIHATACYIDLPANACATALVALAYRQVVAKEPPTLRTLVAAAGLAATTANMKFQLVPFVLITAAVFVVMSMRSKPGRRARLLIIAGSLPIAFATPIKNVVRHGNPVWPIEVHLLGTTLPHTEGAYASSPPWLEQMPRLVRFAASVLELGAKPLASHARWSIDQWTPADDPGYRMGGFFGAYVIVNLLALAYAAFARRSREPRIAAAFVVGTTIAIGVMPQSHELRYYMVWMLVLVTMNLVVWSRVRPTASFVVAACALGCVAWSTRGTYLHASGSSAAELVARNVDRKALERVSPNERVCVMAAPHSFLYAPLFHPKRSYSVQEAEEPEDCAGARLVGAAGTAGSAGAEAP